jgi:hypothetical protein
MPQGLKPEVIFVALSARLKPCPDTKRLFETHFKKTAKILEYQQTSGPEGRPL